MPAIVSHYLLAERVMSDLSELMPDLDINRTAFIWGASGPDIFFCHRILPHQIYGRQRLQACGETAYRHNQAA